MTRIVAGNWKMHHGPPGAADFFSRFVPRVDSIPVRLVFFTPDVALAASIASARVPAEFGVQNIHWEAAGALTGETSAEMAREAGATLALIGHSERRHVFGETDAEVNRKVLAAVRAGLTPVVCVGELLEERRAGRLEEVLRGQVGAFVGSLTGDREFMVAYEPVWAIGTGETATPADAAEAHGIVRKALGELGHAPILYGGSVKPGNAASLMSAHDVDGVLVGGASLDPDVFAGIVEATPSARS
ncbi:MAG: triose-phosphate isomerase [Gemmatimonadetes bacterium]|nr:triose-phosphate isomerase [Gemmatimonadota bacterium]